MREITDKEVKSLIDKLEKPINSEYDYTSSPIFPKGRRDVCAVKRNSVGGDSIYLVWRTGEELDYSCLVYPGNPKVDIKIDQVVEDGKDIAVKIQGGGAFIDWWVREYRRSKTDLGLE